MGRSTIVLVSMVLPGATRARAAVQDPERAFRPQETAGYARRLTKPGCPPNDDIPTTSIVLSSADA